MADLVLLNTSAVFLGISDIRPALAGAGGLTLGQAVYTDPTTGLDLPTNSAVAGKFAFRGIVVAPALGGALNQAVDVVEQGYVAGFDLTALAYDALVYVSDNPGKIGTTAGTNSAVIGRVVAMTDRDPVTNKPSKILYIRPSVI